MKTSIAGQRGVALILVLLIVAMVSVLAAEMGTRLQLQVKRASNIKDNNQAYWYAMGAEQYARKSIRLLFEQPDAVIHLEQPWNEEFMYPLEGGGIQAQLVDMQSCFNLNALREPVARNQDDAGSGSGSGSGSANNVSLLPDRIASFERLLTLVDAEIPSYNIEILRDSLVDWLDEDNLSLQLGAEDSEYQSLEFPYLTANNYMVHQSELRLVKGVQLNWFTKLLDLVCVIPNDSLFVINVNTLTEENAAILAAATGLEVNQARSLIASRNKDGFKTVEEFLAVTEIKALSLSTEKQQWFDVTTAHFMLHTKTRYNNATFAMQTLFKVNQAKEVSIVQREFSGF
jgi:general secretion pathway protein K